MKESGLTGVEFREEEIEVRASSEFRELQPRTKLPRCVWLYIIGKPGEDDFGIAGRGDLIVSQTAFDLLKTFRIKYCEIKKWPLDENEQTKKHYKKTVLDLLKPFRNKYRKSKNFPLVNRKRIKKRYGM